MPSSLPKDRTGEAAPGPVERNDVTTLDEADADTPQTDPGIEEIRDVLHAIEGTVKAVRGLDGNAGGIRIVMALAPQVRTYIDAVKGLDEVPGEVSDLDADEIETLAADSISIVQSLV